MRKLLHVLIAYILISTVIVWAQSFTPLVPVEHAAPFQSGDVWHNTHAEASRVNFNILWGLVSDLGDCDDADDKIVFDLTNFDFDCATESGGGGGGGDVDGPASSTDNAIVRFDGTTGKLLQNSGITIADGASGTLSGTNSGDVTLAGSPNYITLAGQVITRALIDLTSHVTGDLPFANLTPATAATRLLCRGQSSGAGDWEECTLGSGLSMSGNTLTATGGSGGGAPDNALYVTLATDATLSNERVLTGSSRISVTDAGAGSTVTLDIPDGGVTYAKVQDVSAASKLLGRGDSGSGDVQEITIGSGLSMSGTTLSSSGGGGSSSQGTYASLPGTCTTGDLYYFTDSFYDAARCSATNTWSFFIQGKLATAPVDGDYSWVNQGGASVTTTNGGIHLLAPAGAGENVRARVKSAPSAPYTIVAAFIPNMMSLNSSNVGLMWRDSSTGELATCSLGWSSGGGIQQGIFVYKFDSATTFNAAYTSVPRFITWPVVWLRIVDDNTNRTCSVSADGINWMQVHSVTRTDFLNPDQVGFYANSTHATWSSGITLISWKQ